MCTARLALLPLLFLVGCSDSADPADGGEKVVDSPVGNWIIDWNDERTKEFVAGSKKSNPAGGFEATEVEKWLPKTNWVFKDDGTFVSEQWAGALADPNWEPTRIAGKWTQDGSQIAVVPDAGAFILPIALTVENGKLNFRATHAELGVNTHWTFSRQP